MNKFLVTTAIALCVSGQIYFSNSKAQEITEMTAPINVEKADDGDSNQQRVKNAFNVIFNGTPEDVKKLSLKADEINKIYDCETFIYTAIQSMASGQKNHAPEEAVEKVKILIDAGADVNIDSCYLSPLGKAVTIIAQSRMLERDINAGIDKEIKSSTGNCDSMGFSKPCKDITPEEREEFRKTLHFGFEILRKNLNQYVMQMIKLLVENGADVNKTNYKGKGLTALHVAAQHTIKGDSLEPIKYLLEKGANPNSQNFKGATPLFFAQYAGNDEVIKLLIEAGADTTIRDNYGNLYNEIKSNKKLK